jgi:hypothetical protein
MDLSKMPIQIRSIGVLCPVPNTILGTSQTPAHKPQTTGNLYPIGTRMKKKRMTRMQTICHLQVVVQLCKFDFPIPPTVIYIMLPFVS